jgi:hypothetical protein
LPKAEVEAVEAVVFVGLQGTGKPSFSKERFFDTHLRLSLDMLRTRHRERLLLRTCVESRKPFVVDDTNPTRAERRVYIRAAKEAGFRVIGYYFQSRVDDCQRRNERRPAAEQVRPGENPVTGEQVVARRGRIRHELELPVKEAYSAFLLGLMTRDQTAPLRADR